MDVPAVTVPIDTYNHERPASQTQFVVGCGPHMFQREGDSYCTAGSKEANSSRARCHRTSTRALSVGQLTPGRQHSSAYLLRTLPSVHVGMTKIAQGDQIF